MSEERFFCGVGAILNMVGAALSVAQGSWGVLAFNTVFFLINAWITTHA